jgi:hypothetical protein
MFFSLLEHEFHVPPKLAWPDAIYWRALTLASDMPWFLITGRLDGPSEPSRTSLFSWDIDLVQALESGGESFESLLCFRRSARAEGGDWCAIAIAEVWKGSHPSLPEDESPLFLTVTGELLWGPFACAARGAKPMIFVAKQAAPRGSSDATMAAVPQTHFGD